MSRLVSKVWMKVAAGDMKRELASRLIARLPEAHEQT
jgi:uncharacterized protein (DUF2126 family)